MSINMRLNTLGETIERMQTIYLRLDAINLEMELDLMKRWRELYRISNPLIDNRAPALARAA